MKIFLASLLVFSCSFAIADTMPALIKVGSFSEKNIDPNIMNINLQIWAKASTAAQAQEMANKQVKRIKELTEKFKVKKEDVQTEYYSVTPEYAYEQKTGISRIQGYSAMHSLTVTFKNLDEAGKFIDQSAKGDKNDKEKSGVTIGNIGWDSDKKGEAEAACINSAVKQARGRADDLAKAAGVKIKGVYSITNQQVFTNYEAAPIAGAARAQSKMSLMASDVESSTELSPGKIKIRADVNIEYLIQN
ncbi:hypothetical protein CIK05_03185 [Bdellovibrio sp. qaytius]|nr:hypothetical protein CIK05_03185 [Bdellovibrio sp. qaytius]